MPQLFTNNARALLASGITNSATSLTVEASKADLFPTANTGTNPVPAATNWFKVTLQDAAGNVEIVYVRTRTAGSGIMSNLLRGQEGTTARAFSAGTVVGLRITAADVEGSIAAAGNSVQLTGNQTIAGVKTFSSQIVASGGVQGDLTGNATTVTNGVYTTGNQTIAGVKTFSSPPVVPNDSFSFAQLQNIPTGTILGRSSAGTGDIEAITAVRVDTAGNLVFQNIGRQLRLYDFGPTNHAYIAAEPGGGIVFGTGVGDVTERLRITSVGSIFTAGIPAFFCRAWVNFNGTGTVGIRASGNVSSVVRNGTGDYTVNFATPMPHANYAASFLAKYSDSMGGWGMTSNSNIKTANSYRFTGARDGNGNITDSNSNSVAIFC